MEILQKIANFSNVINEKTGEFISWISGILVALVCVDVAVRYLLNASQPWIVELEWHLFALLFILGAGYCYRYDRHVRVDLFYSNFSPRDQALTNLIGNIVFLIPWCLVLMYYSGQYAWESWKMQEGSPDPGGLPARYILKFSVVIGMGLLLIQAIGKTAEAWLELRNKKTNHDLWK